MYFDISVVLSGIHDNSTALGFTYFDNYVVESSSHDNSTAL